MVEATEWISSTITVSTLVRIRRAALVSSRKSDSGVVIRMSGGWRSIWRRSWLGVSPERMATAMSGGSRPICADWRRMPWSGARRLRSTSTASALSGEMYRTRTPASAALAVLRRSRA